jgi:hypothetical protein
LHDFQARNLLEVTGVERHYIVSKLQRGDADGQVFKSERKADGSLLSFDASDGPGDLDSDWVGGQFLAEAIDKRQTPQFAGFFLCAIGAVRQFGNGDNG